MNEIIRNNVILARHIKRDDIKDGLSFFSNDAEYIQVGTWKYNRDKNLQAHYHNKFPREINRTYEVLVILSGSVEVTLFTIEQEFVTKFVVESGEVLVLLESSHGYKILNDNTVVIEVKNGPYYGPEKDRTRINI